MELKYLDFDYYQLYLYRYLQWILSPLAIEFDFIKNRAREASEEFERMRAGGALSWQAQESAMNVLVNGLNPDSEVFTIKQS